MNTSIKPNQSINTWTRQHPTVVGFLNRLNQSHIPWGMYCGTAVSLLTGNRQPNDVDIVVRKCDFEKIVQFAPDNAVVSRNTDAKVQCGDGIVLDFPEQSIKFWIDNTEIEIMASGCAQYNGHWYKLELSDLAIQNRLECNVTGTTLYFANPFDTMALKSVLQRGNSQAKHDSWDIASLGSKYPPSISYAARRTVEVQLDDRALGYLQTCNV